MNIIKWVSCVFILLAGNDNSKEPSTLIWACYTLYKYLEGYSFFPWSYIMRKRRIIFIYKMPTLYVTAFSWLTKYYTLIIHHCIVPSAWIWKAWRNSSDSWGTWKTYVFLLCIRLYYNVFGLCGPYILCAHFQAISLWGGVSLKAKPNPLSMYIYLLRYFSLSTTRFFFILELIHLKKWS